MDNGFFTQAGKYPACVLNVAILALLFLTVMLSVGCKQKSLSEGFSVIHTLKGTDLELYNDLGRASWFILNDNRLIVRDDKSASKFTIFPLNDLKNPVNFGISGNGPGEFLNPGKLIYDNEAFLVFDLGKKELFKIEPNHAGEKGYKPESIFKTSSEGILNILKINDSIYLADGVFLDKRFHLLNREGQSFYKDLDYSVGKESGIPKQVAAMASLSVFTKHPKEPKIAAGLVYGDIFEIFEVNIDKPKIALLNQRKISQPEFTTDDYYGTPNFKPTSNTSWAYLNLTSDEDNIYALFSGKLQQSGNSFNSGNIVRVFDWDGEPRYILKLDREVLKISASSDALYALFEGINGYDIAKYPLSQIN